MTESILDKFVEESRELLEEASRGFLAWEKDPQDKVIVNAIFRAVHTMKGSSGFFDCKPMTNLLHAAEDVMVEVRDGKLALDSELVDVMFATFDLVADWINCLDASQPLPAEAESESKDMSLKLRSMLGNAGGDRDKSAGVREGSPGASWDVATAEHLVWVGATTPERQLILGKANSLEGEWVRIRYAPPPECFYGGEDPLYLALDTPGLVLLAVLQPEWPSLADLDSYSCQLHFELLAKSDSLMLDLHYRDVLANVQFCQVAPTLLGIENVTLDASLTNAVDCEEVQAFIRILQQQIVILEIPFKVGDLVLHLPSILAVLQNGLSFIGRSELFPDIAEAAELTILTGTTSPLLACLEKVLSKLASKIEKEVVVKQTKEQSTVAAESTSARTLKVDQFKIDTLIGMAGELIVAKNTLPYLAKRAEIHYGVSELGRELKDYGQRLGRLVDSFQAAVMQLRLMPVAAVVERFPRLVRDLSRRLNKQVNLILDGNETEADKTIIEKLYDPLLHIIRNSLDHGIESPDVRISSGKAALGVIKISATQDKGMLVLAVQDDGAGIDPLVMKTKALKKRLIDQATFDVMPDQAAQELIFLPGFSTCEEISDVSGRGVGMDVVRTMVQSLGGHLALESTKGCGTIITLRLPLTLAVSRVLAIGCCGQQLGVPIDTVVETIKIKTNLVQKIKHREMIVHRNRLMPVLRLADLLCLRPEMKKQSSENHQKNDATLSILVVRAQGSDVGLVVDTFYEGIDTILKPLEGILAHMQGYLGTALLGDGSVLLVLNVGELLRDAN